MFGCVICLFGLWKNNAASFCVFVQNSVESGVQVLGRSHQKGLSPKPPTQEEYMYVAYHFGGLQKILKS